MNADVEKAVERLERLIPELEYSRETHVQWRDCDQSCRDANPQIGDAKFHAGAVDAYDERMAAISQAIKALRDQEAEIARLKDAMAKLEGEHSLALIRAGSAEAQLRSEVALLRAWARESREGGWSTHQVDPMNRRADEIAAHLGDEHE